MASSTGFDDSEVGLLEESAESGEEDQPVDGDLLTEMTAGEFSDAFEGSEKKSQEPAEEEGEPEETEGDEEPEKGDEEPEDVKPEPGGRAQKRIQQLVEDNKRLQSESQQALEAQQRQMYSYMEQLRQQYSQQQQQVLNQYQQLLQAQQNKQEEEQLDEVGKFRKTVLQEAEERAIAKLSPELAQIKQHLAQQQQAAQQATQQAQQRARLSNFTAQASRAREQVLLADINADFAAEDNSIMDDMLLSYVAATNLPPEQAAAKFRNMLDKIYAARIKGRSAPAKKPQGVPPPAASSRKVAKQNYRPTYGALVASGYDNYIDWRDDGSPKLDEPK